MPTITPRQLSQRSQFYQQLGQLTSAGIPIINAFEMLSRNPPSFAYRAPIEQIVLHLKQGATVAEAVQQLGHWMPAFDVALIRAGEQSGRLDAVFKLLANNYRDRAALLRQMISELMYPIFLFHFGVLIFVFISWIRSSMSILSFVATVLGILAPFYIVTLGIIYAVQGKRGEKWRALLEKLIRPVPVAGSAQQALALARLATALEALINAGVTIIEAWELAAAACGSPAIKKTVMAWRSAVRGGERLSEVVNASPRQFPEVFRNLYNSGEVSGQLDESLQRLYDYYQEEGTHKLRLLAKGVPKIIYFAVVIFVGYKIVSFWTGYYGQIEQLSK